MTSGRPLIVDNDAVMAIWGCGENPLVKNIVDSIKGRDPNRPYAVTMDFHDFAPLVDRNEIHPRLWSLVDEPGALQRKLGAIAFLKAPIHYAKARELGMPKCAISRNAEGLAVGQNYDPFGKDTAFRLMQEYDRIQAEKSDNPAPRKLNWKIITSLNKSSEPEYTTPGGAMEMAKEYNVSFLGDKRALRLLGGSYSIIELTKSGARLLREGNLKFNIMNSILAGYRLRPSESRGVVRPIGLEDLPNELQDLRGEDLAVGLRRHLGWSALHTTISDPAHAFIPLSREAVH